MIARLIALVSACVCKYTCVCATLFKKECGWKPLAGVTMPYCFNGPLRNKWQPVFFICMYLWMFYHYLCHLGKHLNGHYIFLMMFMSPFYFTIIFMIFKHIFAQHSYEQNKSGCCTFTYFIVMKFFFFFLLYSIKNHVILFFFFYLCTGSILNV